VRYHLAGLIAALALAAPAVSAGGTQDFLIVANPSVRGAQISRAALSAIFTGRIQRWGDRSLVMPVDQSARTQVRRAFSASVTGLSLGEIQQYWQRRITADRVFPPPVKDSDLEVLEYVAEHGGAIGYVGSDTPVPEGVKILTVID
jgi:uncharacterized membrane protein